MKRILSMLITVVILSPSISSACGAFKTEQECNECMASLNYLSSPCDQNSNGYWYPPLPEEDNK